MQLVYYPDPVLQKRATAIEPGESGESGAARLAAAMLEVMVEARGIGLAAPQVGESVRLFIASESGAPEEAIVCINPRIEPFGPIVEFEEGCLSIPGIHAMVERPERVRISYTDLAGKRVEAEYGELMARIIQHECDHLDGVLFIERMSEAERLRIRADLKTLEEQYRGP
ncbi:MAG: peptide deformylase [Planctomycetota bacterium]|nr:peptide deformylase [Planctomycetota bacterium]